MIERNPNLAPRMFGWLKKAAGLGDDVQNGRASLAMGKRISIQFLLGLAGAVQSVLARVWHGAREQLYEIS